MTSERRGIAENYVCDMIFAIEKDKHHVEGTPTRDQFKQLVDLVETFFKEESNADQCICRPAVSE
jgi:hypothetical protein